MMGVRMKRLRIGLGILCIAFFVVLAAGSDDDDDKSGSSGKSCLQMCIDSCVAGEGSCGNLSTMYSGPRHRHVKNCTGLCKMSGSCSCN